MRVADLISLLEEYGDYLPVTVQAEDEREWEIAGVNDITTSEGIEVHIEMGRRLYVGR